MKNIIDSQNLSEYDITYFRQRLKNRVFDVVITYFSRMAKREGLTQKQLAKNLGKDPSQIHRWLASPSNWKLDTISDLLLGMGAELRIDAVPINYLAEAPSADSKEGVDFPFPERPASIQCKSTAAGSRSDSRGEAA